MKKDKSSLIEITGAMFIINILLLIMVEVAKNNDMLLEAFIMAVTSMLVLIVYFGGILKNGTFFERDK
jgi:hypothetical protein